MKNILLLTVGILIGCIVGTGIGAYSVITIFEVEIDILGVPYTNEYKKIDTEIMLNDSLTLPVGTIVKEYYSTEYENRYHLVFWYDEERGSSITRLNETDSIPVYVAK